MKLIEKLVSQCQEDAKKKNHLIKQRMEEKNECITTYMIHRRQLIRK
jgi:hypothetical protein